MAEVRLDASEVERLAEKMTKFGTESGDVIQDYLRNEGFERIASHIPGLIHASGRKWKGKATSATSAGYNSVFSHVVSSLTLDVYSTSRYHYLYFPDDGSNTKRHAGNQDFMYRGAEEVESQMVEEMVGRLVTAFEEA